MIKDILRSVINRCSTHEKYKKALRELDIWDKVIVYVVDDDKNILKMKLREVARYGVFNVYDTYLQAFIGRLKGRFKK